MAQNIPNQETYKQVDKFIVSTKILGRGQFGTVYKGFFKDNLSKVVAVKQIALENVSKDPKFIKLLKREIEILMKVKSEYIVQMFHATRTPNNLYMFLDYCNEGDLKELLKKRGGKLTESEAVLYFRQITSGFKALFDMNIIHRDIKPANILLKEGKAKISDFGFAKCLDSVGMDDTTKQTYLGTPLYMSPQILMEQPFSSKCDIWSLGMMFYEMLYGKTPWTGKNPYLLYQNITNDPLEFPDYPPRSELVKDMLTKMLVIQGQIYINLPFILDSERMSWSELFNHQLIKLDSEDIQKQLDLINQNPNKDPLLRSVEANDFYLKSNKVVGIDKTQQNKAFGKNKNVEEIKINEENENNQDSIENKPQGLDNIQTQVIDMKDVFEKQELEKQRKTSSLKIDAYITYERNLGIFVNLTTNFIFKFQNLLDIMGGKTLLEICTEEQFQFYKKSKEYQQTLQLIINDNGFIKPYFKEIFGRTVNFLKGYQNDTKIKKFSSVLNEDLTKNNQEFDEVFQQTLTEFLRIVKDKDLNNQQHAIKRKDMLQTLKYVLVCQNLSIVFLWKGEDNSDFHEFYDKYDNIKEEDLENEILIQLNF